MDWGMSVGGNGDGYNQKRNLDNQRDKHKQWKYPLICPFGERGIFRFFSRRGRTNELITSGIVSW
jgi:hypothetical protein